MKFTDTDTCGYAGLLAKDIVTHQIISDPSLSLQRMSFAITVKLYAFAILISLAVLYHRKTADRIG